MLGSRYRRIVYFFGRVLISLALWELLLPRLGLGKWSLGTRPKRLRRSTAQYRAMAIQMGGVLIKVGQFLSSRVDVLPVEVTSELAGLQDEVPAERFEDIRRVAEDELGMMLGEKYDHFEAIPLAAASLGQVHQAKLKVRSLDPSALQSDADKVRWDDILDVVVKVQRPQIETIIATDMAALHTVGDWLRRYPPIRKRADVPALLREFERTLYEEIDYISEGHNADTFAANFEDHPGILVPRVLWSHTTRRVLTLENVLGIKITDYEAITSAGIERTQVASRLLDTYMQQIFEDGFFHADPHPGNLFIRPLLTYSSGKREWQLTFVDFGMVGRIKPQTKAGMRELLIGVGTQDTSRVIKAYQMLGMLLPGADLALLEKAEAEVFNRFWGKSMSELQRIDLSEMHEFAHQFRELIYDLPFQVPQDLIFLGRCVGILSGMCSGLNPDFNVWHELAPFSRKLLAEEVSETGKWLDEAFTLARKLFSLPLRMDAMVGKMERGEMVVQDPHLTNQVGQLVAAVQRAIGALIFAALLVGGVQLYLAGEVFLAGILAFGAVLTLLWSGTRGRKTR